MSWVTPYAHRATEGGDILALSGTSVIRALPTADEVDRPALVHDRVR
ncbi:hypothetical protein ACGRHY_00370 [Streptomyces sp. HK10]